MSPIPVTTARKNLYTIVKNTIRFNTPQMVTSKEGAVIILSEQEWRNIQETLYLESIPNMKQSIIDGGKESIKECSTTVDL